MNQCHPNQFNKNKLELKIKKIHVNTQTLYLTERVRLKRYLFCQAVSPPMCLSSMKLVSMWVLLAISSSHPLSWEQGVFIQEALLPPFPGASLRTPLSTGCCPQGLEEQQTQEQSLSVSSLLFLRRQSFVQQQSGQGHPPMTFTRRTRRAKEGLGLTGHSPFLAQPRLYPPGLLLLLASRGREAENLAPGDDQSLESSNALVTFKRDPFSISCESRNLRKNCGMCIIILMFLTFVHVLAFHFWFFTNRRVCEHMRLCTFTLKCI